MPRPRVDPEITDRDFRLAVAENYLIQILFEDLIERKLSTALYDSIVAFLSNSKNEMMDDYLEALEKEGL